MTRKSKKIILISLIALTLSGCENTIKQTPTEVADNDYRLNDTEVKIYTDPDTNVEYLIFYFKGSYKTPIVVPRYNADGTLKCLD